MKYVHQMEPINNGFNQCNINNRFEILFNTTETNRSSKQNIKIH